MCHRTLTTFDATPTPALSFELRLTRAATSFPSRRLSRLTQRPLEPTSRTSRTSSVATGAPSRPRFPRRQRTPRPAIALTTSTTHSTYPVSSHRLALTVWQRHPVNCPLDVYLPNTGSQIHDHRRVINLHLVSSGGPLTVHLHGTFRTRNPDFTLTNDSTPNASGVSDQAHI